MQDIQVKELATPAEQAYESTKAPMDHLESSDRSHSRLDENSLVERVFSRIIIIVSLEIQWLTSEAISLLREEAAQLVQEISTMRTIASS